MIDQIKKQLNELSFIQVALGFIGIFILILVIAVMVAKSSKQPKIVQTVKRDVQFQTDQVQVLEEQLRMEKAKFEQLQGAIAKRFESYEQQIGANTQYSEQLNGRLAQLAARIEILEDATVSQSVQIIKSQPKRSSFSSGKSIPISLPTSGYRVQAVVGERAWISNGETAQGENNRSVTVGDASPVIDPKKQKNTVNEMDATDSIVITTHDSK